MDDGGRVGHGVGGRGHHGDGGEVSQLWSGGTFYSVVGSQLRG